MIEKKPIPIFVIKKKTFDHSQLPLKKNHIINNKRTVYTYHSPRPEKLSKPSSSLIMSKVSS